jgi:hypothetical protein
MLPDDLDLDDQVVVVLGKGRRQRAVPFGRKTALALDLAVDGGGLPLSVLVTGANTNDSIVFEALLDDLPAVRTPAGRRHCRPDELAGRDLHSVVRLRHAPAGVGAGTAGRLTQLVDEVLLEVRDVGPPELPVDPVIASLAGHDGIHHRRDRIQPAKTLVQRRHLRPPLIAWRGHGAGSGVGGQRGREYPATVRPPSSPSWPTAVLSEGSHGGRPRHQPPAASSRGLPPGVKTQA